MSSIILIGMPGCGKTVVGRALSELAGLEFFDTDEFIERETRKSIPEIFADIGEPGFRELETRALTTACERDGRVIATGGGAVCAARNKDIIKRAGTVIYLTRELDMLPTNGRPLSGASGVRALYEKRAPLYESWSDARAANDSAISDAALNVLRAARMCRDI